MKNEELNLKKLLVVVGCSDEKEGDETKNIPNTE